MFSNTWIVIIPALTPLDRLTDTIRDCILHVQPKPTENSDQAEISPQIYTLTSAAHSPKQGCASVLRFEFEIWSLCCKTLPVTLLDSERQVFDHNISD